MATDDVQPEAPVELWRHSDPTSTAMYKFMQHLNAKYSLKLDDYPALYRWSIENVAAFWEETWYFVGIKASTHFDQVGSPFLLALFTNTSRAQNNFLSFLVHLIPHSFGAGTQITCVSSEALPTLYPWLCDFCVAVFHIAVSRGA